jgi:hypothetical protein
MRTRFAILSCFGVLTLVGLGATTRAFGDEPDQQATVNACIQDLTNPDEAVRFKAAKTLGKLGAAAKAAIPALTKVAQEDADEDVRRVAKESLRKIEGEQPTPQPETPSLVGNWKGTLTMAQFVWEVRSTLKADGTYVTILSADNIVTAERGTYRYADGVLTATPEGGFPVQATVTWVNRDQFVYKGNGMQITFRRQ